MRKFFAVLFSILSVFTSLSIAPVFAKTQVDVYHAEVAIDHQANPVKGDKRSERIAARDDSKQQGLEQVLIKASGNRNIADNDTIQKALTKSQSYVETVKAGTLHGKRSLDMSFNPEQVNTLLANAGSAIWPAERENILVWIVEDDSMARQIGWDQSGLDSVAALRDFAEQAGLPLTFPIGDIDDITKISPIDLWNDSSEAVQEASNRYSTDAVLIIKIEQDDEDVDLNWQLFDTPPADLLTTQTKPQSGKESDELATSMQNLVDDLTSYYFEKNKQTQAAVQTSQVMVNFTGIKSSKTFVELREMLNNLPMVDSAKVSTMQSDAVTFTVKLKGTKADLVKELAKDKTLIQLNAPMGLTEEQIAGGVWFGVK
ncbi:MAG: DUF2066 domain-containing protein [Vibrio sp.]